MSAIAALFVFIENSGNAQAAYRVASICKMMWNARPNVAKFVVLRRVSTVHNHEWRGGLRYHPVNFVYSGIWLSRKFVIHSVNDLPARFCECPFGFSLAWFNLGRIHRAAKRVLLSAPLIAPIFNNRMPKMQENEDIYASYAEPASIIVDNDFNVIEYRFAINGKFV